MDSILVSQIHLLGTNGLPAPSSLDQAHWTASKPPSEFSHVTLAPWIYLTPSSSFQNQIILCTPPSLSRLASPVDRSSGADDDEIPCTVKCFLVFIFGLRRASLLFPFLPVPNPLGISLTFHQEGRRGRNNWLARRVTRLCRLVTPLWRRKVVNLATLRPNPVVCRGYEDFAFLPLLVILVYS